MSFRVLGGGADDYDSFARLFPELGVIETVPSAERFREVIAPESIFLRDGDAVVGYAWARARGEKFHVVHVIVDPAHRRRGVGKALMAAMAERARAKKFETWILNVKPENGIARALYESCGMRDAFESLSMRFEWRDVKNLTSTPEASARLLDPSEDARFEAALAYDPKEVSNYRALGRQIFGAEISGAPIGVGVLDAHFPGASPFRVSSPSYARVLFEKMREHALPEHDHLLVFVENDPKLEAELTKAGAVPAMRVLRMEGRVDDFRSV